jgi:hypothetical protein
MLQGLDQMVDFLHTGTHLPACLGREVQQLGHFKSKDVLEQPRLDLLGWCDGTDGGLTG